ncbi:ImmA/IrrE family metallo-endopeptidase [Roseibium sp.]|uniref:ImmA/IrrE family metallo-endopeptidase n=1 Tax=Roseibium sp. TaxID=1936156 RepID=UPI003BABD915
MSFYSYTLKKIMAARGVAPETVAKSAGISAKTLFSIIDGDKAPTKRQIINLAKRLAVPPYAFFIEDYNLKPSPIVDFRANRPKALQYGKDAAKFEYIVTLRDFLADLYQRLDYDAPQQLFSSEPDENPEQFARSIENILNLRKIRTNSNNKVDFFKNFRKAVEDLGIFIIQDHHIHEDIDGFALYHDSFTSNLIFVNSGKRNQAAKSFTIAHELAHILGKRSAISNNYEYDNEIESYANEFAACLLIPREEILSEIEKRGLVFADYENTLSSAKTLSEYFKSSISAVFVRLERLGLSNKTHTRLFLSGFGKKEFPDSEKPRSFGSKEGPKPGVIDSAFLGERASNIIADAIKLGVTTKYEVFENTGLSKKRIDGLISNIESAERN